MKPPIQWFGGKRKVASQVWREFGEVDCYLEPFLGSGAVLLGNPHPPVVEHVNDINGFLVNWWRAVQQDPEGVSDLAQVPVMEVDLAAKHAALARAQEGLVQRLLEDPHYADIELAGWWAQGHLHSFGGSWSPQSTSPQASLPHTPLTTSLTHRVVGGRSFNFRPLQERIRNVTILCGDWRRTFQMTSGFRRVGLFLDPPYRAYEGRYGDAEPVWKAVAREALQRGEMPGWRVALCGHEHDYDELGFAEAGWRNHTWKRQAGYQSTRKDKKTQSVREVIWFSPQCTGTGPDVFDYFSSNHNHKDKTHD